MGAPTVTAIVTALLLIVSVRPPDLDRALAVGRGTDAERARFHSAYVVPMTDDTVEQFEVLTEFRRAVIIVEGRVRFGDYMFSAGQLEAALRPFHNQVTIRARLRFHPQNVMQGVPAYELVVGPTDERPVPLSATTREPILVPAGKDANAIMGATLTIVFDSGVLGQHRYPVAVALDGRTVAATVIDFARLD